MTVTTESKAFDVERTSVGKSSASRVPSAMPPAPAMTTDNADVNHNRSARQEEEHLRRRREKMPTIATGSPASLLGETAADDQADEAGDRGRDRTE